MITVFLVLLATITAYGTHHSLVILPSLTFDVEQIPKVRGYCAYEERSLWEILALTDPAVGVTFISSSPISADVVDYFVSLVGIASPRLPLKTIRDRLTMVSIVDDSPLPLAQKLLDKIGVILRLRHTLALPGELSVFRSTEYEWEIASLLKLKLNVPSLDKFIWGTKSGSRDAFRQTQILHPAGTYTAVFDEDALIRDIIVTLTNHPTAKRGVVKLQDAFSGKGNVVVDVSTICAGIGRNYPIQVLQELIRQALLDQATFFTADDSWPKFVKEIERMGAIFELFVEATAHGSEVKSPSVQSMIHANGQVEILSSHDQIMHDDGQSYIGCTFPALDSYREDIIESTMKVGQFLALQGVVGYFGVDFISIPVGLKDNGVMEYKNYALEINLRKTGTTHPFMYLKYLTGGALLADGSFQVIGHGGEREYRVYIANDRMSHESFTLLTAADLLEFTKHSGLHYSPLSKRGVVFTIISPVSKYGMFGIVAIGETQEQAKYLYEQTFDYLLAIAERYKYEKEFSLNE